ncbi:N-acetyltransferase GCN5 [Patiriisocius marinistellae]|uniref:N-acetyltransferase GCN5 n=1 Tax=Patiriisocius marinistellae TaxID=2494560 RepID=A0A5J4FXF7_9FLAO|nr:GNAT family N-acetyltransferase [Patiriisocius marinistellae]GEQ85832.1 N-acetyltransferase GCN5 [Patiriisocius marinistellae]
MDLVLETERLLIRPFKIGDEKGVFCFSSNPEVQKYTSNTVLKTIEEAVSLIKNVWLKDYDTYGYGRFAVIDKTTNKIIGFNGLKYISEINQTDLGYRFLPEYWGKGIATESSKAIITYAFDTLKLSQLIAFVEKENLASTSVLKKLGFAHNDTKPYPGETVDLFWYKLTKSEYQKKVNHV